MKFKYTVDLSEHLPYDEGKRPIETHTGIVEAEDYLSAKEQAWAPIGQRAKEIQQERGIIVAIGNIQIDRASEAEVAALTMTVESIIELITKHISQAEANERKFAALTYQVTDEQYQQSARIEMHHCAGQKLALQVLLSELTGQDFPVVS